MIIVVIILLTIATGILFFSYGYGMNVIKEKYYKTFITLAIIVSVLGILCFVTIIYLLKCKVEIKSGYLGLLEISFFAFLTVFSFPITFLMGLETIVCLITRKNKGIEEVEEKEIKSENSI